MDIFSQIKIYSCREHFLVKWLNDYSSPLKFIKIRLAKFLLNTLFKGTIYDRAIGIEKRFSKLISEVLNDHSPDLVCVTGAPFNLMYYATKSKQKFPKVKIVCDYRDPWLDAQNYGMQNLSPEKKTDEENKQNYIFEHADVITAPNAFLLQEIKETYTGKNGIRSRFVELQHAFDPDDVLTLEGEKKVPKLKFIYGGTLYLGLEPYLEILNENISYLKEKTPKEKWPEFVFYTPDMRYEQLFQKNTDLVKFKAPIGEKIFDEVIDADFVLILLSQHNRNYVTSKFYEFLPYRKPYLYVGPEGHVSDKINNENLGKTLVKKEDLFDLLQDLNLKSLNSVDLERYTFNRVAGDLLEKLNF
jgi:hypothetical protein